MSGIVLEDTVEIPFAAATFSGFRRWSRSRRFPHEGRIDYLTGQVEVDMSPEQFFSHGGVKAEVVRVLGAINHDLRFGLLRIDRTRVVHPQAELSVEPDIVLSSDFLCDLRDWQSSRPADCRFTSRRWCRD